MKIQDEGDKRSGGGKRDLYCFTTIRTKYVCSDRDGMKRYG